MPISIGRTAIGWSILSNDQVPAYVIPVAGGIVTMRLRPGDVGDILVDVVKRFDATVEPVYQGVLDDWSYNRRKVRESSDIWSEHAAGTAVDLNATQHGRGARGTFNAAEVAAIRELLDVYEGVVAWGGDFGSPGHSGHVPDEMHFQISAQPGDPAIARVAAKIRALEDDMSDKDVAAIKAAIADSAAQAEEGAYRAVRRYFESPFTHIGDEAKPGDRSPLARLIILSARGALGLRGIPDQLRAIAADTSDDATKAQVQDVSDKIEQLLAVEDLPAAGTS